MEQSYEITEDGKAKTLNPYGAKPVEPKLNCFPIAWEMVMLRWQQAEDSRVTYEIGFVFNPHRNVFEFYNKTGCNLKPGTIVQATLHNGKLRIK